MIDYCLHHNLHSPKFKKKNETCYIYLCNVKTLKVNSIFTSYVHGVALYAWTTPWTCSWNDTTWWWWNAYDKLHMWRLNGTSQLIKGGHAKIALKKRCKSHILTYLYHLHHFDIVIWLVWKVIKTLNQCGLKVQTLENINNAQIIIRNAMNKVIMFYTMFHVKSAFKFIFLDWMLILNYPLY